jgi:thiamine kinase-like enzyme
MFVIDWELSHLSDLAFDLGQMFAELFELKHFKDIDAGVWLIEAFMKGYGKLEDQMAFRTAIHVGVHLICWGSRVQGWGSKEQVEKVVEVGRDFVVKGWEKDRGYFEGTALECLFA